jgi:membrane protein YdbS with pleckstrin-like domain
MSFTNVEIELETLPRFADVQYRELHPRYAPVVLGVALAFQVPVFLFATALLFGVLAPRAGLSWASAGLLFAILALFFAFLAWFSFKSARVMRYALRQHDVILQSGVFWKKETVQPIRRIQHVEQHQGPVDKRFGLYELKLFSAGTAQFTFRIPGLDGDSASRIRQFILKVQEDGWGADEPPESAASETRPELDG